MASLTDLPRPQRAVLVEHATHCAKASSLVYSAGQALLTASTAGGFAVTAELTRSNNFGVIFDRPDLRIIAFRGTDEVRDWLTNLNFLWRKSPWGIVRRGFWDAARSFQPEVEDAVAEARAAGKRVWVTGHSMGGAIAVLTVARLAAVDPLIIDGLCTFGQPPVAGVAFRLRCDEVLGDRYIRLVNHTDAVVEAATLLGAHCGWLWYFDATGRLYHKRPFTVGMTDPWKAARKLGGLYMFTAHGLEGYLEPLAKLR
jgi:pimeloyl-ACP methyl ester carboxylesterase